MSFWSALGTLGGLASFAIPGVGPALGTAILSAGSTAGQALDAYSAEKKGAKQQQAGYQQAINALQPYNAYGQQASGTLAGLLGMPSLPMGTIAEMPMTGAPVMSGWDANNPNGLIQKAAAHGVTRKPNTLEGLLQLLPDDRGVKSPAMSRPQTPSAKARSSYRTPEAN